MTSYEPFEAGGGEQTVSGQCEYLREYYYTKVKFFKNYCTCMGGWVGQ